MIATLQKENEIYTARYERQIHHSVEKVWAMLTDNDKLQQWFTELEVVDLRKDGLIKFDMQDGTFIDMKILDYEPLKVLAFEWGEDIARFEAISKFQRMPINLHRNSFFFYRTDNKRLSWLACMP